MIEDNDRRNNEEEDFSDQFWNKICNSARNEESALVSLVINFLFCGDTHFLVASISITNFVAPRRTSVICARFALIRQIKSHYLQSSYACKWNRRRARVAKGRSIILFIRVLTYDYDTQVFSDGPHDTCDFLPPKGSNDEILRLRMVTPCYVLLYCINLGATRKIDARNYIIIFNTMIK